MFHHMTCQGWRWGCPTHKFRPPILSTMHSSVIASYKLLDPITKRKRGHPHYWQMPQHPPISTTQAQTLRLSNPTFHTVSGFLVLTAGQNTVWTSLEISRVLSVKLNRLGFTVQNEAALFHVTQPWLVFFFLEFCSGVTIQDIFFFSFWDDSKQLFNPPGPQSAKTECSDIWRTTVPVHLESQVTFSSCQKQTSAIPEDREFFRLYVCMPVVSISSS